MHIQPRTLAVLASPFVLLIVAAYLEWGPCTKLIRPKPPLS